eukprot:s143_g27.t1
MRKVSDSRRSAEQDLPDTMVLIPKKTRRQILEHLFKEGRRAQGQGQGSLEPGPGRELKDHQGWHLQEIGRRAEQKAAAD